jgi:hypothetical protein
MMKRFINLFSIALVLVVSLLLGSTAFTPTTNATNGNNGTIKIHEKGTPSGTENNDPKVCIFNVEGFKLDANQAGYLKFDVQGGDKPTGVNAGPYNFGPTNAQGFYASQYFTLKPGHYKATLYGKKLPNGNLTDVKAKSKVFKVTCSQAQTASTTPVGNSPHNNDVTSDNIPSDVIPTELPKTGSGSVVASLLTATAAIAAYAVAYVMNLKKLNIQ